MSYLDFELEIAAGSGRKYPVTVVRSVGGEVHETMLFPFDELALENQLLTLQNALLRSGGRRRQISLSEEQAVQNFGRALFDALFIREVRSQYAISQREAFSQGKGLRLKLRIQSSELAALPWEFLYDPDRATYVCLSSNTPIVRYLEVPRPPQPLAVTLPLRVLGMVASPKNLVNLDVDNEKLRIEKATENLQANGLCELTWLEGRTWHNLQRAMRGGPWHIFHFIGHGGFDSHADEGLIALEDEREKAHFLSATQLGRLLADHRPLRLVILNSCESGRGSTQDIFSSTAAILARQGIPAVLAMQYEITDRAAIELSRAFYEALADGVPVDTAVSEARKAISIGVENTVEWGTPVLYMCSPDGILFNLIESPDTVKALSTESAAFSNEHEKTIAPFDSDLPASAQIGGQANQSGYPGIAAPIPKTQPLPQPLSSMGIPVPRKAAEIFYSYAHKDEHLKKKLEIHLSLLKQEGLITGWYDREIRAGAEWASEIEAHLNSAHIILLLVSPDFMASDYCYSIEMRRALERHEAQEARVIPVILRPTDWERAPFSKLQALPADRRPITRWSNRDEAFLHVAQDIRKVVDELNAKLAMSASTRHVASSTTDLTNLLHGGQVDARDKWLAVPSHTKTHSIPDPAFLFNQPLPDPGEFYGRVRERETLLNRTRNGASTSIVGSRRIGKTWLMSYLKLVARRDLGTRYLVGYLDATTARCATVIGFTASAIEALGVERRTFNNADAGLAFLEQVVQELTAKNQVPVLCIDEFEGFGNRQVFDLHFFTALRAMTQNGLCLIVASKIPLIDIISDYGKTSGFFNVFEQLMIRPFSSKEAERFVRSKGTQAGLTEQEQKRLLQYGQHGDEYWPVRLQLAGKMLLEDKVLAVREQDQDYYRPEDPDYWQEFEHRLEEIYGGVMR